MSLRAKSVSQTSDGQRSLLVISSVRFKRSQSTRSCYTKGIIKLPLESNSQEQTAAKPTKDAA